MIQKGTSAVSPLFAALTTRLMSIYGMNKVQQDFQNGGFYRMLSYRDITTGKNGAGVGWDAITGMGSFAQYLAQTTSSTIINPTSTSTTTTTLTSNGVSLGKIIFIIYNIRSF
jgi:hypothetical protein